jgi:Leucine-rich repeat (LRR) protein
MAATANDSPDPTTMKPPRARRWIPLSLRFLVLFVPFVGIVGFTWVSVRGYSNALAIREIERMGGEVLTRRRAPEWLQNRVSDDRMELFDEVTSASLGYATVTDSWLAHLSSLSSLEDLWLTDTHVTDAGLAHLTGLRNLQSLGLSDTRVTDAGLAQLAGLTSLQRLNLDETQVTDAGLAHLSGLTNLEFLSLKRTKVTDAGLAHLAGLTSLQRLELESTQVTDAGLAHLSGLINLQRLDLQLTQVTDAGIAELKLALPDLTIHTDFHMMVGGLPYINRVHSPLFFTTTGLLIIGVVTFCLLAIAFLLPLPAAKLAALWARRHADGTIAQARAPITSGPGRPPYRLANLLWFGRVMAALIIVAVALRFAMPIYRQQLAVREIERLGGWFNSHAHYPDDDTRMTVVGLEQLDRLISLQGLWLSNAHVTDAGLAHLERLTTLQALSLNRTPVTDAGLANLKGLANLHELDLENTHVTDAGLALLEGLTSLYELSLNDTQVTDAGLRHLKGMTKLQKLELRNTQVTCAGLNHLKGLKTLVLGGRVTDASLVHLKGLPNLQSLNLRNTQVTDAGLAELAALMSLQELSLGTTQVTEVGLTHLKALPHLERIMLDAPAWSAAAIDALRRALPSIDITWNP